MMKIKVTFHWINLEPTFLFAFLVIVTTMQSN